MAAVLAAAVALLAPPAASAEGPFEGVVLTTALSPAFVPPGAPVVLSVHAPAFPRQTAVFEELAPKGWHEIGRVVTSLTGDASFTLYRSRPGAYDLRVTFDPGVEVSGETRRLVVTATGFGDPRAYAFTRPSPNGPGRWDPCRVITYRTNLNEAPPGAGADVAEAVRRLAQATGMTFQSLGGTSRVPGSPDFRYDADLDIAWAKPDQTTYLRGEHTAGVGGAGGGPAPDGAQRFTHGFVVINVANELPPGFGAGAVNGAVLLHELGHAVGLAHVTSPEQMMQPAVDHASRAALYGAGDLAGLRRLGRAAGCH